MISAAFKQFGSRLHRAVTAFAYDAVEDKGRRKAANPITRSEDRELWPNQRRQLISGTRDLQRNFSIAAWAIRKHLDYVSTFKFQPKSGIPEIDDQLEALMAWYQKAENCDIAARHTLRRFIRLIEACRTVDGDIFVNHLNDGRLQAIEGDRVRTPTTGLPDGYDATKLNHGVYLDDNGRAIAFAVSDRPLHSSQLVFRAMLSSDFCRQLSYYTRFDQVRGISPLSSALNAFRDIYENFDYALAKAKISQLFGLKVTRDAAEPLANFTSSEGDSETDEPRYKIDFGHRGPIMMDLDEGDDVDVIESDNPSQEFQQFTQEMVGVALKALDIPICFYDEGRANFSSGRQGWQLYNQSAETKRDDLRELLDFITACGVSLWVARGSWKLPAGKKISDIKWEWIHAGIPWLDPLKEATANNIDINNGLTSRQRLCKQSGDDFFQIMDEQSEELAYAKEKGVVLATTPVSVQVNPAEDATNDGNAGGQGSQGNKSKGKSK